MSDSITYFPVSTFHYSKDDILRLCQCYHANLFGNVHVLSKALTCFTTIHRDYTMPWLEFLEEIHALNHHQEFKSMHPDEVVDWMKEGLGII